MEKIVNFFNEHKGAILSGAAVVLGLVVDKINATCMDDKINNAVQVALDKKILEIAQEETKNV